MDQEQVVEDVGQEDEAMSWASFAEVPMDAVLFLKLLAVCDFRVAEATVLWDLVAFHRHQGLKFFKTRSGPEYVREFPSLVTSRCFQKAIVSLDEQGLIEQAPVVRNVSRKFRLNWVPLWVALSQVSPAVPGLGSVKLV